MKTQMITVVLVLFIVNAVIAATEYEWVGPDEGLWSNPNNWSPAGTPGTNPTDTIIISGEDLTIIFDTSCSVQSVAFSGNIFLKGELDSIGEPAYVLEGNITNSEKLYIRSIKLGGQLTNNSGAALKLSTITGSININNMGTLNWYMISTLDELSSISNSGMMDIRNPGVLASYGSMVNAGTLSLVNTTLNFYDDATFTNTGIVSGSGYLVVATALSNSGTIKSMLDDLVVVGVGEFINDGRIFNEPGTHLTLSVQGPYTVRNRGQIEAFSGGGVSMFCYPLINEENGYIGFYGGFLRASMQANEFSTLTGRGELIGSLNVSMGAEVELYQSFTITSSLTVQPSAQITLEDAQVLVEGVIQNDGVINLRSSRLIPRGGLQGSGQINWDTSDYNTLTDYNLDGTVNLEDLLTFSQSWLWVSPAQ